MRRLIGLGLTRRVERLLVCALVMRAHGAELVPYPWQHEREGGTIQERFAPPAGFLRVSAPPGSFAEWLRGLPLRTGNPPVRLYDGALKPNQQAHLAVLAVDTGDQDLQQCADAVIRLRAEYLRSRGRDADICFHFTSGHSAPWTAWRDGQRPVVAGKVVRWVHRQGADGSYASFRAYLQTVFRWAGSASLSRELALVREANRVELGDVFIEAGFPGHAVLVVDVAEDARRRRQFMLAQSYMPAQEIHVVRNPFDPSTPWYQAEGTGELRTPEWRFSRHSLHRFLEKGCADAAAIGRP